MFSLPVRPPSLHSREQFGRGVILLCLCLGLFSGAAFADREQRFEQEDGARIRSVIEAQLAAFKQDDAR